MSLVLVTGHNGVVGRHVTRALLGSGHRVIGASLQGDCASSPPAFIGRKLDITDDSATRQLLSEHTVDAVVHLAALVHVRHEQLGFAAYNRVNHRASEQLFTQATRKGVRRFLFASTIEVYGPTTAGQSVAEDAPCSPESDYARTKLLAEEALTRVAEETSSKYAIMRLAPAYSPDFRLNLEKRLFLRKSVGFFVGNGDYQLALCHLENIAYFVTRWLGLEEPASGIFNLADRRTYPIKELLQRERLAGRCPVTLRLPYAASFAAIGALQTALSISGRQPGMICTENLRKLVRSATWDTRRATLAVGPLPWLLNEGPNSN